MCIQFSWHVHWATREYLSDLSDRSHPVMALLKERASRLKGARRLPLPEVQRQSRVRSIIGDWLAPTPPVT